MLIDELKRYNPNRGMPSEAMLSGAVPLVAQLMVRHPGYEQRYLQRINNKKGKDYRQKLFRVVVSPDRTDFVLTNDLSQDSTNDVQKEHAVRWKIEEFNALTWGNNEVGAVGIEPTTTGLKGPKKTSIQTFLVPELGFLSETFPLIPLKSWISTTFAPGIAPGLQSASCELPNESVHQH